MARYVGVEFYLPPDLVEAIDEKYDNRSEAARRLFAGDLGVEIDA